MIKKMKRVIVVIMCISMVIALMPSMKAEAATTKISKCTVKLSKTSFDFSGSQCKPKVTVKYKGKNLKSGKDYTVSYANNVYAGNASVIVKGKGKYSGSVKKSFKIKNNLTVKLSKTSYQYDGSAFKPKVTVKSGKTVLKSKDYSVSYKSNKAAGKAYAIVKGKGKYKGKNASAQFTIKSRHIADTNIIIDPLNMPYTGKECKPEVKVTYKGKNLVKGTDFTVKYSNNVNKGNAKIDITGKGNFFGTVNRNFNIGNDGNDDDTSITVQKNNVTYDVAGTVNESGKLQADQRADNILSGFNVSDGEKGLNHPNGIASDGKHFVVCDTWNNRVLVYNTLPTANTKPNVVIGQPDFKSFRAGGDLDKLNWPVSATFAGSKLIIADTNNNRLLVYNSVPTTNGAMADSEIKSVSAKDDIVWPWAVWSDGTKLIATSTKNGKVAFWDSVNGAISGNYADKLIDIKGTPRTIISNGKYVLVGDHNLNGTGNYGSHIWKNYPTSSASKPDFTISTQYGGGIIDGNLYGVANDGNYYVYSGLIDSASEKPVKTFGNIQGYMQTGDYNQILYVGGKTYATYYNSSIIGIYNGKISDSNYMTPVGYLGADKKTKSANVDRGLYQNPIPATDGKSLVLVDDYNRLLAVYKKLPNTNNVRADIEYHFASVWDYPIDVAIDKAGKMFVLTAKSVLVWNKVPTDGEMYDAKMNFDYDIGKQSSRIEVNDNSLFIYSEKDGKIFKLDKNAKSYSFKNALKSVSTPSTRGLSCNGEYLVVTFNYESKVKVLKASDLTQYGEIYKEGFGGHLNLPTDAIILPNGQVAVVDSDRMVVWNSLSAAVSDRSFSQCFDIGRTDKYGVSFNNDGNSQTDEVEMATDGALFTPTNLAYSNGHLWVGEFKFSSRLLRYDLK